MPSLSQKKGDPAYRRISFSYPFVFWQDMCLSKNTDHKSGVCKARAGFMLSQAEPVYPSK